MNKKPDYRRDRLLADGRKALASLEAGKTMPDLIMAAPFSRARLYRAMAQARLVDGVPLQRQRRVSGSKEILLNPDDDSQSDPIDSLLL